MPVTEKTQSQDEINQEKREVAQKTKDVANKIFSSLDLPDPDKELNREKKPAPKEKEQVQEPEETEEEVPEEKTDDSEQETDESDDEDEDLVPKSKVKKRIDSLVSARKVLEAKVAELEAKNKANATGSTKDRLEALSESELKDLRLKVRAEWKRTDDPDREAQLDQLQEDIDDVLKNAPARFQQKQVSAYENKAREIIEENDEVDFDKHGAEIKKIAIDIYNKYSELHQLERGQATALEMAFEHWKVLQGSNKGKSKELELKRQNMKLKQKTSLDSGSVKGNANSANRQKDFEAAKKGGTDEKASYLFNHVVDIESLVPELRRKG